MKTIAFITYYIMNILVQIIAIMIASSAISFILWDTTIFLWLYDHSSTIIRGILTFSFFLTLHKFIKDIEKINELLNK